MLDQVVIHPYFGEFGWMIMDHLSFVQEIQAREKIVCCEKGMGWLFPSATGFFTDFKNPISENHRQNKGARVGGYEDQLKDIELKIKERYPNHIHIIHPKYSSTIKTNLKAPHKLPKVDIVFGARYRSYGKQRNYPYWFRLVRDLQNIGLKIGVAGAKETTFQLKCDASSWTHPDGHTAGTIDLLNNCRLYVGVDSGVSHLASLMNIPSVIAITENLYRKHHEIKIRNNSYCQIVESGDWNRPNVLLGEIIHALNITSQPKEQVVAITTLMDGESDLLPAWIEHYLKLGVDKIIIAVNLAYCKNPNISSDIFIFNYQESNISNLDEVKDAYEEFALDAAGVQPTDWVLHVDLDEFHEYTNGLVNSIKNAKTIALAGKLLDRIPESRKFEYLDISKNIFKQFSLGGRITQFYGGCITKVMAARRQVSLMHGRHGTSKNVTVDWSGIVHHFKYRLEGIQRVKDRCAMFGQNHWYTKGSQKLLSSDSIDPKIKLDYYGDFKYE